MSSIAVNNMNETNGKLEFTLSKVDVSVANAVRRVILADIETVVFKQTDMTFTANTSRLNNEILGQRLSCIPIHLTPEDADITDLLLEFDAENLTSDVQIMTTDDFKIKVVSTGEYWSKERCRTVFKPYVSPKGESYFIPFVRLRPRISDDIPGEHVAFVSRFSIGTANENSMFNVVGTCAYGCSVDEQRASDMLGRYKQQWEQDGMSADQIEKEARNWELLEKKRIIIPNSFDYVIESVGPIPNSVIVNMACQVLVKRCQQIITSINDGQMKTTNANMSNDVAVDYILDNEDYTIGNVLNYLLFKKYYAGKQTLSYCGFKKMHPHDSDSIIRLMFKEMDELPSSSVASNKSSVNFAYEQKGEYPPSPGYASEQNEVFASAKNADVSEPKSVLNSYGSLSESPVAESKEDMQDESFTMTEEQNQQTITYAENRLKELNQFNDRFYDWYENLSPKDKYALYKESLNAGGIRGGGELNERYKTMGFGYIQRCCEEAIQLFESIGTMFR